MAIEAEDIKKEASRLLNPKGKLRAELTSVSFPIEIFPGVAKEIIEHYSKFRSFPLDFIGASVLCTIGSAIGNSYQMKTRDGYINKANMYIALVAPPGTNKSAPLAEAYAPLVKKQTEMYLKWKDQEAEKKSKEINARAEKNLSKCKQSADKVQIKKDADSTENQHFNIDNADNAESAKIKFKKPIMSNCTLEALIDQLDGNSHGVTIVYDELAGLFKSFNKYRKGDDEEFYISGWKGTHISRDTLTHGTIEIPNPFLSTIGTIQPALLNEVFIGNTDNGFFDRFLLCYLDNLIKPYPGSNDVNPIIVDRYSLIINNLFDLATTNDSISTIGYSNDGYQIINQWERNSIDIENHSETGDTEKGVRAKMAIYVHRFALVLQMLKYGISQNPTDKIEITDEACNGAVKLAEYFLYMAEKTRIRGFGEVISGQLKQVYDSITSEENFNTSAFIMFCDNLSIPERTAKDILKRNIGKLWVKVKHGTYSKIL